MKMTTSRALIVCSLSLLFPTIALQVFADEAAGSNRSGKSCSGMIISVDPKEKTVTVKHFWFTKTFNVADNCAIAAGDKKEATLNDLRRGQKVEVTYKDASGVLVASRIDQQQLRFDGSITAIDPDKHRLTVSRRGSSKTFKIPDDCKVVLRDEKSGTLNDVKLGHRVTVLYEAPEDVLVVRQIQQPSATFVGTVDAIDASARTIRAKHFGGDKKFNLADNCKIVINGKPNAALSDLRIGQRLVLSYDEADGVYVVNRIAPIEAAGRTETAQSKTGTSEVAK